MSARPDIKGVRDAPTLALLRESYRPGTIVEAIKVRHIASGVIGVVREVKASGDIEIIWNTGEVSDIEFGTDSIKISSSGKCFVKRKPDDKECEGSKCSECGWNETVHNERIKRIRNGEMVMRKTAHGEAMCLIVKRSKNNFAKEVLNSNS